MNQVYSFLQWFLASALGAFLIKVLDVIWQNWIVEKFDRRKQLYTDKRLLADEVIKICTEASVGGFTIKPRSVERIYYIMTQVAILDPELAEAMEVMLSRWLIGQATMELQMENFTLVGAAESGENYITRNQWVKEADEKREFILNKIAKWKK
jgi:hypothetical protein